MKRDAEPKRRDRKAYRLLDSVCATSKHRRTPLRSMVDDQDQQAATLWGDGSSCMEKGRPGSETRGSAQTSAWGGVSGTRPGGRGSGGGGRAGRGARPHWCVWRRPRPFSSPRPRAMVPGDRCQPLRPAVPSIGPTSRSTGRGRSGQHVDASGSAGSASPRPGGPGGRSRRSGRPGSAEGTRGCRCRTRGHGRAAADAGP